MRQIHGTIIVTFYSDLADSTINEYLNSLRLEGVRVSQFRNRYAVEIPAGQEDVFLDKFQSNTELVEKVNEHYIKGIKERPYKPKKKDE